MTQATLEKLPFHNSNLFSAYYLSERLQDRSEWDCDEDAREALDNITDLYEHEKDLLPGYKEDALIDSWIDEVLDILGYGTNVETTLPEGDGYVDVLLFEDTQTRRDAAGVYLDTNDTTDLFEGGLSLLEAKQWDADFSKRFSENRPYYNASQQIRRYLDKTPSNIEWGILTNGRKWRLYGTKDHEAQIYYEVDLPELIENGNLDRFKYFYLFFRPAAFRKTSGSTFLDAVWSESETATQELGDDLQDNVFRALRVLGHGIVETNDLDIDPNDDEALSELKEQSLVLLYRLMFVLYAESRQLIDPEGKQAQKEYEQNFSLNQHRLDIHDTIGEVDTGFEDEYSTYSTTIWNNLQDLFRLVDQGKESLGIPPYNGGLFDHDEHAYLTEHKVSDRHLAEVIYRLSTTENDDGRYVLADYGDLDTRHLGSVYEGLLEHQFRIAPEDYAAVAEDGGQIWKPATEVTVADAIETVEEGSLYVTNDEGERKATGAYYTPDYVVNYIVKETIAPLVDEIREDLVEQGFEMGTQEYLGAFLQRVTQLKILDPAMGSGHFLTGATGYLAEQVMKEVREVEVEIGVAFNEQHVRREIAKECIYGVDINGMAVELAKLSMWLETLAADRPLAFLDHHLKAGNSLIGSNITEVLSEDSQENSGQLTLSQSFARARQQTLGHVMELMADLLAIDNEKLEDIKSMEELYDEIRDDPLYQRLFEVANVHTAEQFGVDVPEGVYENMAGAIDDKDEWAEIREKDWFKSAQALSGQQSFFHWELEYPEVFFGEDGERRDDAGFDGVLGNPPWGAQLSSEMADYISVRYGLPKSSNDTFACFTKLGSELVSPEAEIGYILPSGWQTSDKYLTFREWLVHNLEIEKLVNLPYDVFADAYVDSSIFILKDMPAGVDDVKSLDSQAQVINYGRKENLSKISPTESNSSLITYSRWFSRHLDADSNYEFLSYLGEAELNIGERVAKKGTDLKEFADVQRGITPFNLVDESGDGYAPGLDGGLRRYTYSFSGQKHVEYHDGIAEYKPERYFEGERLILRELISRQFRLQLILTEEDFVTNKSYQSILVEDDRYDAGYLLAVLNSSLLSFYHVQRSAVALRDDFPKIVLSETRTLPVPKIDFSDDGLDTEATTTSVTLNSGVVSLDSGPQFEVGSNAKTHDLLAQLARSAMEKHEQYRKYNLDIMDYLGSYEEGPTLSEVGFAQPSKGVNDSVLPETTKQKPNLRIGDVEVGRESPTSIEIRLTARYKPDNEDNYETDQWGYTETEPLPAFRITDLSEIEADLIEAFVPVAVDKAGGFADFRDTATKSNSLIDRIQALTLPAVADIESQLQQYIETKERAEKLESEIMETESMIDDIVVELFDLGELNTEPIDAAVNTLKPQLRSVDD